MEYKIENKQNKLLNLISSGRISFSEIHEDLDNKSAIEVWQQLYTIRMNSILKYSRILPTDYINNISKLNYSQNHIPSLSQLNNFLNDYGWSCCWSKKLSEDDFFYLASNKIFAITSYCRDASQLERSTYPDFIHDLWGHIPLLSNEIISELILMLTKYFLQYEYNDVDKKINKIISLNAKNSLQRNIAADDLYFQQISMKKAISRLFLFTVEFGLLGNVSDYKVIGGGIISSDKELSNLTSNKVKIKTLQKKDIYENEYCLHDKQNQYFILDSTDPINNVKNIIFEI